MRILLRFIPLVVLMFIVIPAISQTNEKAEIGEEDEHAHHTHHKNEIGVANSLVYFVNEESFHYGLHAHYIRNIGESKFGLGLGYERIFDEHKHNTVSFVGAYRPVERLYLVVSPGVTFEESDYSNPRFALHLEGSYEFELGSFHIGPAVEFAYDPEDYHISIGLHVGYGF